MDDGYHKGEANKPLNGTASRRPVVVAMNVATPIPHHRRWNSLKMKMTMTNVTVIVTLGCGTVAILEWLHLGYRLWLFAVQSHYVLNNNHVDAEIFTQCYAVAAIAAAVGGISFVILRPLRMFIRCALVLYELHRTRILVAYEESTEMCGIGNREFQQDFPVYVAHRATSES